MRYFWITMVLLVMSITMHAQATFDGGWHTYKTGTITREFNYNYLTDAHDSFKFYLIDSTIIYASDDSLVTLSVNYSPIDKSVYKTTNYLGSNKLPVKRETYKDKALVEVNEWKYDKYNRVTFHTKNDKANNRTYTNNYDFEKDKDGDSIVTESQFFNGKIEFYTKDYYNGRHVHTKQVRLNDNKKDVLHIETYIYDDNGYLKERSVYFPEYRVTKKFDEDGNPGPDKCNKTFLLGNEFATLATKISFLKKLLYKNKGIILDKSCPTLDCKFRNNWSTEVTVSRTKANVKTVLLKIREKVK